MSITELSVLPRGARVEIRRGRFPADPALVGREGLVVEHSQYFPHKVSVSLDGDPTIHEFAPDEVEVVSAPDALPADKRAAKKRLARP
ncbi:MAG: hypothetical protein ACN0LA_09855 [Candidatus Longimicrobiales bacterium M2_2A_002]